MLFRYAYCKKRIHLSWQHVRKITPGKHLYHSVFLSTTSWTKGITPSFKRQYPDKITIITHSFSCPHKFSSRNQPFTSIQPMDITYTERTEIPTKPDRKTKNIAPVRYGHTFFVPTCTARLLAGGTTPGAWPSPRDAHYGSYRRHIKRRRYPYSPAFQVAFTTELMDISHTKRTRITRRSGRGPE